MQELDKKLTELQTGIARAVERLDLPAEQKAADELAEQMRRPGFWQNQAEATAISRRQAALSEHIEAWRRLEKEIADTLELLRLGDDAIRGDIERAYERLAAEFSSKEFELKLSGPYDRLAATVSIYAGTGGTDAQDWAEMLMRMYLRWAERRGFEAKVLDISSGEEAGIKSVTFEVNGSYAYGYLKSEKGVHRLVRQSPFNADNLRQTSFALVEVMPQIPTPELEIDPADLKIDVFRASGHGGQSVNTTDSAVRITHLPTKITVSIQNERSQMQNKEKALAVLKSRLAALMEDQHQKQLSNIKVTTSSEQWGSQIRSYVLHPYQMVKDHRTSFQTADTEAVLNGEIDGFIEAYLRHSFDRRAN